jgi:F-type H+-transporting ATPase subunit b
MRGLPLRRVLGRAALVGALIGHGVFLALPVGVAWAQHNDHSHGHDPVPGKTNLIADKPHGDKPHGSEGAHGGHHGPGHINWTYGFLGEKEGLAEPDLLFRPKGMPAPFLANIINFGVVMFILVSKAGPMVSKGLIDRRDDLQRDIEAAAKAKAEALKRYEEQKSREDHIEEEIARIRSDYAEQGKIEAKRIEQESKERHERFVREAHTLIEQEGRALRQRMLLETVDAVTASAESTLRQQIAANDHERLANEFLSQLGALASKRGAA